MSDPTSKVEIEDVLSSIRRLVSEGPKKGPARTEPEVAAPGEEDPASDAVLAAEPASKTQSSDGPANADRAEVASANRLVLTPALRIADKEKPDVVPDTLASLEATIAELEAAVAGEDASLEEDALEEDAFEGGSHDVGDEDAPEDVIIAAYRHAGTPLADAGPAMPEPAPAREAADSDEPDQEDAGQVTPMDRDATATDAPRPGRHRQRRGRRWQRPVRALANRRRFRGTGLD